MKEIYSKILNKKIRQSIRNRLMETFGVSYVTINTWLSGKRIPPSRYHNAIAEIMGIPVAELFPETDNCSAETNLKH